MRKYYYAIGILCFCGALSTEKSYGQTIQSDSVSLQNSLNQTVANFYIAIDQQSRLYNGPEYLPYDRTIKGNALYPLDAQTWALGEVNYDGVVYKGIPMMYDIYKDKVVMLLYNHFSSYTLLDERVHDFSFSGRHFVRVNADSLADDKSGISTGFYEQLYAGKLEVLAKRIKNIQNSTNTTASIETYFTVKNEYYLRKGNTYYRVRSKGSFISPLKDKRAALQQYIKNNNIDFSDAQEAAMVQTAAYYDQL
jgi:hypothetical protein